jgi:hypothetical protein
MAIHQPGDSDVMRDLHNVKDILSIKSGLLDRLTATNNQRALVGLEPRNTAQLEAEVHSLKRKVECKSEEAKKDPRLGVLCQTSGLVTAKWGSSEPNLTHSIDWALSWSTVLRRRRGRHCAASRPRAVRCRMRSNSWSSLSKALSSVLLRMTLW